MTARRVGVAVPGRAPRTYEVRIGDGCLADELQRTVRDLAAPDWFVVVDQAIADSWGGKVEEALASAGAAVHRARVPSGESSKSRESAARLQDEAIAARVGRDGVVVAVGGGVVGDLAGFVAATLYRGLAWVQVPTTLLAMVDSSVGGKTGVDTAAGKNLVGAFHQPARVVADVATLSTLPDRQLRAGLAEVIKYGVILDEQLFIDLEDGLLESCTARVPEALAAVVERCVALKGEVVADDEREAGRRQILNFGHTVGHALESLSGYRLLHGEAVAVGMVAEARLAERKSVAEPGLAERIGSLCERARLPVEPPSDTDVDAFVAGARRDKKVRAGVIRCALPRTIGAMAGGESGWSVEVSAEELRQALG